MDGSMINAPLALGYLKMLCLEKRSVKFSARFLLHNAEYTDNMASTANATLAVEFKQKRQNGCWVRD